MTPATLSSWDLHQNASFPFAMNSCSQRSSVEPLSEPLSEPLTEPTFASLKLHPLLSPSQEHVVRQFSSLTMLVHGSQSHQQQQQQSQQQECHQQQQRLSYHGAHHHRHTASEPQAQLQGGAQRLHPLPLLKQNAIPVERECSLAVAPFPEPEQFTTNDTFRESERPSTAVIRTSSHDAATDVARLSPQFAGSALPASASWPSAFSGRNAEPGESAGSVPVSNSSGFLLWLRTPSELDLNFPGSLVGNSTSTPPLPPPSPAFPSSFQVLNSSFWKVSGNCGANGGASSPSASADSSESSLVDCGSGSSSTDMDEEEEDADVDDEDDDEAVSQFKLVNLKKKTPAMASFPSQRSLSSHFGGKSRTFASLADVAAIQSIHSLAKPPPGLCLRKARRQTRLSASSALRRSSCAIPIAAAHRSIGKHRQGAVSGAGIGSSNCSLGRLAAQQVQRSLALAVAMGSVG